MNVPEAVCIAVPVIIMVWKAGKWVSYQIMGETKDGMYLREKGNGGQVIFKGNGGKTR